MRNKDIVDALKTIYYYMMEKEDCNVLCMDFSGRIIKVEILEYDEDVEE